MVRRNEVAPGIPHDRTVELLEGLDDILAEAMLVRKWVSWIPDTTVDAAAHVPV